MALPTTDITTTMVKNELGASTNNVSELCTHADVNMWSRRKPVQDSRISVPLSEVGYSGGSWGLNVPDWNGGLQTWTYFPPLGSELSPYRLGDFRGYHHAANRPLTIQNYDGDTIGTDDTLTISASVTPSGGDSVSVYDMNISNYYLSAEIEKDDGEKLWGSYSGLLLPGDESPQYQVKIRLSSLPSGWTSTNNLIVRLFLSSEQKRFSDSTPDISNVTTKAINSEAGRPTTQNLSVVSGSTLDLDILVTAMATSVNGPWTTINNMGYSIGDTPFVTSGDLALKILVKGSGQFPLNNNDVLKVNPTYGGDTYEEGVFGNHYDSSGNLLNYSITATTSGVEAILFFNNLLNRENNAVFTPQELIEIVSELQLWRPSVGKNLGTLVKPFKTQ